MFEICTPTYYSPLNRLNTINHKHSRDNRVWRRTWFNISLRNLAFIEVNIWTVSWFRALSESMLGVPSIMPDVPIKYYPPRVWSAVLASATGSKSVWAARQYEIITALSEAVNHSILGDNRDFPSHMLSVAWHHIMCIVIVWIFVEMRFLRCAAHAVMNVCNLQSDQPRDPILDISTGRIEMRDSL